MGKNSKIEWTDHTFNPWTGCEKVSPACDNCYAEARAKRAGHPERWNGKRVRTSASYWAQPLRWQREAAESGVRRRVFCASLADVFDNVPPPAWRADLFRLIRDTPHLDWLLLTKRIGNAEKMIKAALFDGDLLTPKTMWPWPNVWVGSTVVTQEEADRDIPKLLATPARVRFLSIEPMLGPIDLTRLRVPGSTWYDALEGREHIGRGIACELPKVDWVIVGGESGHGARWMQHPWPRSIRDQCAEAGVPFLFKQWGEHDSSGMRVGKKAAGRILDGVTHDGFPVPA